MKSESRPERVIRGFKSKEPNSAIQRERMMACWTYQLSLTRGRHVINAAQHPIELDDRQVNAVTARIELDLRIGAAFTRLQTLQLQTLGAALEDRILSYGVFSKFISSERSL